MRPPSPAVPSLLFATKTIGLPDLCDVGKCMIEGCRPDARVNHEKNHIGLGYRRFGLRHMGSRRLSGGLFEPGRVDHRKGNITEAALAFRRSRVTPGRSWTKPAVARPAD